MSKLLPTLPRYCPLAGTALFASKWQSQQAASLAKALSNAPKLNAERADLERQAALPAEAIGQHGYSSALSTQLSKVETRIAEIDRLLAAKPALKILKFTDERLAFVEPLTDRELRVLNLLADGLSNPQIARLSGFSRNTVKFHVSSIIWKLGATSRTEAATIGVKRGADHTVM